MATATSLTATKIEELLSGWEGVELSQSEINSLIIQLTVEVDGHQSALDQFNNIDKPALELALSESVNAVSDLNDNTLPQLQGDLANARETIQQLVEVDIPSIQNDVVSTVTNVNERPKVYVQDEAPENPDENDRELVVGDTWFDSNDNNRQRIWNGAAWSTFNIDVADFSLTVKSFMSSRHQIY